MGSKGKEINNTNFGLLDKYNHIQLQSNINDFFFRKPVDAEPEDIQEEQPPELALPEQTI